MEWYYAFALLLGTVCCLMFLGLPVALAFFAANVLGTALFIGGDVELVYMAFEFNTAISFGLAPHGISWTRMQQSRAQNTTHGCKAQGPALGMPLVVARA